MVVIYIYIKLHSVSESVTFCFVPIRSVTEDMVDRVDMVVMVCLVDIVDMVDVDMLDMVRDD